MNARLLNQIVSFFGKKKVNILFGIILIIITLITVFYEEKRVSLKQSNLFEFEFYLKSNQLQPSKPINAAINIYLLEFNQKFDHYLSSGDKPYVKYFIWNDSDDDKLILLYNYFQNQAKDDAFIENNKFYYKDRINWINRIINMRNECIPDYLKFKKRDGRIVDAMFYGLFKGLLTNFMFYNLENRSKILQKYGPNQVNDFYCYAKEQRYVNILTSFMFSIGILFPFYFIALSLFKKK